VIVELAISGVAEKLTIPSFVGDSEKKVSLRGV
jgi:hypothetical protein